MTRKQNSGKTQFDVIVIGGGLAGLAMTALLAARGVRTLCVDREDAAAQLKESFDGRTTAISFGSQKVLEAAGAWKMLEKDGCPINTIHILDGDSPVLLDFDSVEVGGRAFGWIFENRLLRQALMKRVAALPAATHITGARVTDFTVDDDSAGVTLADNRHFTGTLVIGADGRTSFTREWMGIESRAWSYKQRAVVCTVVHDNPHDNVAVEHFREQGPFAILPMTDTADGKHRSSVVWTEHGAEKDSALHYDQATFDTALQARFPDRYGKVAQVEKRFSYPLGLNHAHSYIGPRMALVAEAAHGIHPIAGQGLNMSYRDIAALAELIGGAHESGADVGADTLLQTYQHRRRFDNMAMAGATDTLNRLFSNAVPPVRALRRAGLKIVARTPFAKRFFMHQAMGAAGLLPSMIADSKAA